MWRGVRIFNLNWTTEKYSVRVFNKKHHSLVKYQAQFTAYLLNHSLKMNFFFNLSQAPAALNRKSLFQTSAIIKKKKNMNIRIILDKWCFGHGWPKGTSTQFKLPKFSVCRTISGMYEWLHTSDVNQIGAQWINSWAWI